MELNIRCMCLATIVLCALIRHGLAIQCWDCRSDFDPKCSDPFDNSTFYMTDCAQQKLEFLPLAKSTMCRKIRQKVHGTWRYMRSCAYLGEPGIQGDERFCLMRTGTYNIFMEYCTCNSKDGCNTSSHLQSAHISSLVAIVVSLCAFAQLRM